jgi:hypothetical protein
MDEIILYILTLFAGNTSQKSKQPSHRCVERYADHKRVCGFNIRLPHATMP